MNEIKREDLCSVPNSKPYLEGLIGYGAQKKDTLLIVERLNEAIRKIDQLEEKNREQSQRIATLEQRHMLIGGPGYD